MSTESWNETNSLAMAGASGGRGGGTGVGGNSALMYIEILGYGVCLVMIVFGNTLTLVAMHKFACLQRKEYVTMKYLTIADLFLSVYIVIVYFYRYGNLPMNRKVFRYVMLYMQDSTLTNGVFHVVLVAADRFLAVLYPFFYERKITQKVLGFFSAAIWVTAIIFPFFAGEVGKNLFYSSNLFYVVDIIFYGLAAVLMICLNGRVATIARQQRQRIESIHNPACHSNGEASKRSKKKFMGRATVMMLVVVVVVYLILYLPVVVSSILRLGEYQPNTILQYTRRIGTIFATLSSGMNFIIYAVFNKKCRTAYKLLLSCSKGNCEIIEGTLNGN